ncbi:MAG TPA: hypothetical protein VE197_21410 [Mycobacterium sp.]|jgi:hypothetical protein|nr:hypothetical protein [Mycobacterium sp.]
MRSIRSIGVVVAALVVSGSLAVLALAAAGASGKEPPGRVVAVIPRDRGGSNTGTCFWGQLYDQFTRNIIWPDTNTAFPNTIISIPSGGKLVLHGQFPHARFFSFTVSSLAGVIRSTISDADIVPDPGSINPYVAGANRNASNRSFTVTVLNEVPPSSGPRAPNTVYGGATETAPGAEMQLVERIYLADQGLTYQGGVRVPAPTYIAPDGTVSTGDAACVAVDAVPGVQTAPNTNPIAWPETTILRLLALPKTAAHRNNPAVNPPVWYKSIGNDWWLAPYWAGTPLAYKIAALPFGTSFGLAANPASSYAFTWLDRDFGPNRNGRNIAVLRGRLPTTPDTYFRNRTMQGGTQLRYWGFCNNEGLPSGAADLCLADQSIAINRQRFYTIVLSLPQDRPRNASRKCGVTWMNYGTRGDGYTRPRQTLVYFRNVVVGHTSFPAALQNIPNPTTPKENVAFPETMKKLMGPYLPTVTYTSPRRFEKLGCPA